MAPGVAQNSETLITDSLTIANGSLTNGNGTLTIGNGILTIANGNGSVVKELVETVKACPVELQCSKVKPVRRVIRPKVLKNLESHDYLYDRLYDSTCPRVVSGNYLFLFLLCKDFSLTINYVCSFFLIIGFIWNSVPHHKMAELNSIFNQTI